MAERHRRRVLQAVTGIPSEASERKKKSGDIFVSEAYPESEFNPTHDSNIQDSMEPLQDKSGTSRLKKRMQNVEKASASIQDGYQDKNRYDLGNEDNVGEKKKKKKHKSGLICVNEKKETEKKRPSSTEGCGSIYEECSEERKKKKKHKNDKDSDENQYDVGNGKDSGEKKKKRKYKHETDNGELVKHKGDSPSEDAPKNADDSRRDKKKKKLKQVVATYLEQPVKGHGGDGLNLVNGEKDGVNVLEDGNMGKKKKKKKLKAGSICLNEKNEIEKKRPSSTNGSGSIYEEGSQERKKKIKHKNIKDSDENEYDVGKGKDFREKRKKRKHETDNGELVKHKGGSPSDYILKNVDDSRKDKKKKKQKQVAAANFEQPGNGDGGDCPGFVDGEKDGVSRLDDDNREKKKRKGKAVKNGESQGNGKPKKVSFSGHVEVFPPSDGISDVNECEEVKLVQGKRFTEDENELVMNAVHNYIEAHGLGEEGVDKLLNCKKYPEIKNCWKEIGAALPWRPYTSVYYRAHVLLERSEKRTWTPEECEFVREHVDKHGPQWRALADELGKHRSHVKDTWRRIKLLNKKKGSWSQDEYQKLFDLVNTDLRLKASEEKKTKHGMLRDNICWSAISDKLSTRAVPPCCMKWYNQLSSPMSAQGMWADSDDYRLLDALTKLDACCIEDVDWDNLLEHRPGEVCRTRWDQMVRYIGHYAEKSFSEQVDILADRYRPDLLEAKVAYENKPAVDIPSP